MPESDAQLLRRTLRGHSPSARSLWERHAPGLRAYAASILGRARADAADDIVQSVFCSLLSPEMRLAAPARDVPAWLAALTRNHALQHLRAGARARRRESTPRPTATPTARESAILNRIDSLPRRLREVLYLRHVAGLTVDQTALALAISRGTVASRHHAAIQKLRSFIDPDDAMNQTPREIRHALAT